jgi:hypothetical protein
MKLKIFFPKNMITDSLIRQERIPCVCRISTEFEISFSDTVPASSGTVLDWDRRELEQRAAAGAGGKYTHHSNSLITLNPMGDDLYEIVDLEMFYDNFGWCAVMKNGEYAPPGSFWDEE